MQEQDYEDRNLSNCRCFVLSGMAGAALADPWKDESGHGRWRGGGYNDEPR